MVACVAAAGTLADDGDEAALPRAAGWWVWGCAIISPVFAVVGQVHFGAATMTLLAASIAAGAAWLLRGAAPLDPGFRVRELGTADRAIAALLALWAALAFLGTLSPEVRHDPLFYHLQVPRLWLNFGRIVEVPENGHSYFPYGHEMLYAWCLGLGSDSAAKGVHWASGLALAGMTARLARVLGARPLHAAALVYFLPAVMYLSTTTYIDLATAMYGVAAIALLFGDALAPRRAAAFGFLVGSAMATKYTAWPLLGIPLFAAFAWRVRLDGRCMGAAILCAAVPVAPWVVRNLIHVGNPVAPLLVGVFGPESARATGLAGSFDAFAGAGFGPTALLRAPVEYAGHLLFNKYPLSVLGLSAGLALWWMRRRLPAPPASPTPARVHPAALLVVLFLAETFATRGHPDGRYALASQALGAVLVCALCARLGAMNAGGRCLLAPTLAILMGLWGLADWRRLQAQLHEDWLQPRLSGESRRAYLLDHGVITPDHDAIEEALHAEGAGRVLGSGYPSRERYWVWIQGMRNDLVPANLPAEPGSAVPRLYRSLLGAHATHIVRDGNPGVSQEVWEAFLARHTEPVGGVPVRRILRPANPGLMLAE